MVWIFSALSAPVAIYTIYKIFFKVENEKEPIIDFHEKMNGFNLVTLTFRGAKNDSYVVQDIKSEVDLFKVEQYVRKDVIGIGYRENINESFHFKEICIYNKDKTVRFAVPISEKKIKITIKYSFFKRYSFTI